MTYLRLYHDGTSAPELTQDQLVLLVVEGRLSALQYNREATKRERKLVGSTVYLNGELISQLTGMINAALPDVFVKKHPVYLLMPPEMEDTILKATL